MDERAARVEEHQQNALRTRVEDSLLKVDRWVQANGWAGYDPYDLEDWWLSLPERIRELRVFGRRPSRFFACLGRRYPRCFRRIFVEPKIYPKAMGLFTEAYVSMYEYFRADEYLNVAKCTAQWLLDHVSEGYRGYGWGLPIDWQSLIFIPAGTPCGTVSAICGDGFWKLYEVTAEGRYLEACQRISQGFVEDLKIDRPGPNMVCFSYTPLDSFHVHNLNLMIAAFLARVGSHIGNDRYVELAIKAGNYAVQEQRDDGSLDYWGRDQTTGFRSDHYHSGFDIRALHSLWKSTGLREFQMAAQRYYEYYKRSFFGEDGAPLRNPDDVTLIDIHGCAEALICNAQVAGDFPRAYELLQRAAVWTIENMQRPAGYFIYRIVSRNERQKRIDIPYIRWGQAWMMRGLTACLEALGVSERPDHSRES